MKHKRLDSIGFSKWSLSVFEASVSMQLCFEKMKKKSAKILKLGSNSIYVGLLLNQFYGGNNLVKHKRIDSIGFSKWTSSLFHRISLDSVMKKIHSKSKLGTNSIYVGLLLSCFK